MKETGVQRMTFSERLGNSHVLRRLHAGDGTCSRCQMPWTVVDGRIVKLNERDGIFAIFAHCWDELGSEGDRLSYYEAVVIENNLLYPDNEFERELMEVREAFQKENKS